MFAVSLHSFTIAVVVPRPSFERRERVELAPRNPCVPGLFVRALDCGPRHAKCPRFVSAVRIPSMIESSKKDPLRVVRQVRADGKG